MCRKRALEKEIIHCLNCLVAKHVGVIDLLHLSAIKLSIMRILLFQASQKKKFIFLGTETILNGWCHTAQSTSLSTITEETVEGFDSEPYLWIKIPYCGIFVVWKRN